MTRNDIGRYLGKDVTITLYDGAIYAGILHQTGEKAFADNPNLSVPLNFYFCIDENNEVVKNTVFRVSHIQKISCNEKLRMTNFERIKSMSKEQMTHFMLDIMLDTLNNNVCGYCENCDAPCLENEEIIRKWLGSEVEE